MIFIICIWCDCKGQKSKRTAEVLKSIKGYMDIRQIGVCVFVCVHIP